MSDAPQNPASSADPLKQAAVRPVSTFPGPWTALPAKSLLAVAILAPLVGYMLFCLIVWVLGPSNAAEMYRAGIIETGVLILPTIAYLALLRPHRQRPVSLWVLLWTVGTIVRMFVTLGISLLVYFATDFSQLGVFGSFLVSWFFLLTGETWICASHLYGVHPRSEAVQPMEPGSNGITG